MFDPINGPGNPYMGPATGLGTEGGDSWDTAIGKINSGFKNVVKAIEGGLGMSAPDDVALGERLSHIEDSLTAMQIRLDALTGPTAADLGAAVRALGLTGDKPSSAANTQSEPQQTQNALTPPPETPAPIAAAIPVTSASTYIGAGGPAA